MNPPARRPHASTSLSRRGLIGATGVGLGAAALGLTAGPAPLAHADNAFYDKLGTPVKYLPPGWPNSQTKQRLNDGFLGAMRSHADGVPRVELKGQWVIHPTLLGNYLNGLLDSIEVTNNTQPANLARVSTAMSAMAARGATRRGGLFMKYEFDWSSFNGPLPSPWYSSFGQSKFPRVAHRLYTITGERRWLGIRDQLVRAFLVGPEVGSKNLPWVAAVDPNHQLWLEEYPTPEGRVSAVYNGHYYALMELLQYRQVHNDPVITPLIQGAANTMNHYRALVRNPGGPSNYYASKYAQSISYHYINTACYLGMYNLTGHEPFAKTVDGLVQDWRFTDGPGKVFLRAGRTLVTKTVTGPQRLNAGPTKNVTVARDVVVNSGVRSQFGAFAGVWSRMEDGPLANHWVREEPNAYREGFATDRCDFRYPREVWFEPGTTYCVSVSAQGRPTPYRNVKFTKRTMAHSTLRAKIGGVQQARIDDGAFAGRWVQLTNVTHF